MKTWLSGDVSKRLALGGDAEIAHELGVRIERIRSRLAANEEERKELEAVLRDLMSRCSAATENYSAPAIADAPGVTAASSTTEKFALFRRLFAGRPDVFPVRWENRKTAKSGYAPACAKEWVRGICGKPQVKCGECPNQAFIPVSDDIIEKHLRGGDSLHPSGDHFVAGVYPLLPDETCWFLAADFDKENWAADALAMLETCRTKGVPAALERSRSGNGGHVWIFFSEPVPARTARQLGAAMLTETMERRPEIGFASYDRFFPSQDTMPVGGFGNLIALPLQRRARELGNSVFIDKDLRPYDDQWSFLAAMPRLSGNVASEIVADAELRGRVLGVRMPVEDEDADKPWRMAPSRRPKTGPIGVPLPSKITIVVADQLYIDRIDLPSAMTARLIRLAAFQNPEFYLAQSMRFPTFGKPRIISCAELHARHVGLPRGCLDEAVALIRGEGAEVEVDDLRVIGNPLPSRVRFQGTLYGPQVKAFDALLPHDHGVLAATTGPSARRLWLPRSLRIGGAMRSFSSIVASCSPSGWSG